MSCVISSALICAIRSASGCQLLPPNSLYLSEMSNWLLSTRPSAKCELLSACPANLLPDTLQLTLNRSVVDGTANLHDSTAKDRRIFRIACQHALARQTFYLRFESVPLV